MWDIFGFFFWWFGLCVITYAHYRIKMLLNFDRNKKENSWNISKTFFFYPRDFFVCALFASSYNFLCCFFGFIFVWHAGCCLYYIYYTFIAFTFNNFSTMPIDIECGLIEWDIFVWYFNSSKKDTDWNRKKKQLCFLFVKELNFENFWWCNIHLLWILMDSVEIEWML